MSLLAFYVFRSGSPCKVSNLSDFLPFLGRFKPGISFLFFDTCTILALLAIFAFKSGNSRGKSYGKLHILKLATDHFSVCNSCAGDV